MSTYEKHFSKEVIKGLKLHGMKVIGAVAVPGPSGTYLDSETAYLINRNEQGILRSYLQVVEMSEVQS